MSSFAWHDWVFWIAGVIIASGGVVLFAWALLWDRAQGRRRCPRCWYDMAGAAGLVCPECGKDARRERRFTRTRRRWRWAGAAIALCVLAYASWVTPAVRRAGALAAVPTIVLIESFDPDWTIVPMDQFRALDAKVQATGGKVHWRLAPRLLHELERRLEEGKVRDWELRRLIRRCVRNDDSSPPRLVTRSLTCVILMMYVGPAKAEALGFLPEACDDMRITIRTRKRWPRGEPIVGQVWGGGGSRLDGGLARYSLTNAQTGQEVWSEVGNLLAQPAPWWMDWSRPLGSTATESGALRLHAKIVGGPRDEPPATLRQWREDLPIEVVASVDEVIEPLASPSFDTAVARIGARRYHYGVVLDVSSIARELFVNPDAVLALRLEVRHQGSLVATGGAWWNARFPGELFYGDLGALYGSVPAPHFLSSVRVTTTSPSSGWDGEGWTVRLIGDPSLALHDVDATKYWKGEVEVPLAPAPVGAEYK